MTGDLRIRRSDSGVRMETVERLSSIPIVESSINSGLKFYNRIKKSNRVLNWSLSTSENVVLSITESLNPALIFFESKIGKVDKVGVKILDCIEHKAPNLCLPPQMLYWNTKEYVADRVVKPVLKRADSIGEIVDNVIDKADFAIEKYFPDKVNLNDCDDEITEICKSKNHAIRTFKRSQRLSKKIKTKISSRTAAEVKALRSDVSILIYGTELIIRNPIGAIRKLNDFYYYLSEKEPENQTRPQTVEEVVVIILRETARKIVHLINFTGKHAARVPRWMNEFVREIFHQILYSTDFLLKIVHNGKAENVVKKISFTYDEVQKQTNCVLEKLAIYFSGRLEAEKIEMSSQSRILSRLSTNGLY